MFRLPSLSCIRIKGPSAMAAIASMAAFAAFTIAPKAQAVPISQLSATYYSVPAGYSAPSGSGSDFGTDPIVGYTNDVQGTLGADGLPVYNPASGANYQNINSSGELLWWPSQYETGQATVNLPINEPSNFFPPNGTGTSDSTSFLTAIFAGQFTLTSPTTMNFNLGADDDAYLFVDGQLVADLGGIQPLTTLPVSTAMLGAGHHTLKLFYADRHTVQAALQFSLTTSGVQITPVPEPGSLGMYIVGLLGLFALFAYRRRRVMIKRG